MFCPDIVRYPMFGYASWSGFFCVRLSVFVSTHSIPHPQQLSLKAINIPITPTHPSMHQVPNSCQWNQFIRPNTTEQSITIVPNKAFFFFFVLFFLKKSYIIHILLFMQENISCGYSLEAPPRVVDKFYISLTYRYGSHDIFTI